MNWSSVIFCSICSCVGPDKVGRKELRQKLILFSRERFALVVPRKYISVRVLSLSHYIIKESFLKCKRTLKRLVNGPIVWLSVCPSVCMYVSLSVRLRVRLFCFLLYHLFLVPSVGLSTHLRPLLALYVRPFLLSFRFPVSLSVYLSVPLFPRLPFISRLFLSSVCFIIIFPPIKTSSGVL